MDGSIDNKPFNYIGSLTELLRKKKIKEDEIKEIFKLLDVNTSETKEIVYKFQVKFNYEGREFLEIVEASGKKQKAKNLVAKTCLIKLIKFLREDNPLLSLEKFGLREEDLNSNENQLSESTNCKKYIEISDKNLFLQKSKADTSLSPSLKIVNKSFSTSSNDNWRVSDSKVNSNSLFSKAPNSINPFRRHESSPLTKAFGSLDMNDNEEKKIIKMNDFKIKEKKNEPLNISKNKNLKEENNLTCELNANTYIEKNDGPNKDVQIKEIQFLNSSQNFDKTQEAVNYLCKNKNVIQSIFNLNEKNDYEKLLKQMCSELSDLSTHLTIHQNTAWLQLNYKDIVLFTVFNQINDSVCSSILQIFKKLYFSIKINLD